MMTEKLLTVLVALLPAIALAQQPVRPLPRQGNCPSNYISSGAYCTPGPNARGAIERVGTCPSGFITSGPYCLATQNAREAIHKTGSGCPNGWITSGQYCLRVR